MNKNTYPTYASKRSFWIGFILWGIVAVSFIFSWYFSFKAGKLFDIKLLYIYLPLVFFVGSVWFGTSYTLTEENLEIRVGPWFRKKIPYRSINGIKRNRSYISAPAFSSDRLLIKYNLYNEILISPEDDLDFVAKLKKKNQSIRVDI